MKERPSNSRLGVLVGALTAILVGLAGMNVSEMRQAARDSAHSALWHEINSELKGREVTGKFPARLDELRLTFPDNGSPEMLELIEYRREGEGCFVSTTIRGKRYERGYGGR
jgi:hypothetical protein